MRRSLHAVLFELSETWLRVTCYEGLYTFRYHVLTEALRGSKYWINVSSERTHALSESNDSCRRIYIQVICTLMWVLTIGPELVRQD